jgi:chromosome segregation ATPase
MKILLLCGLNFFPAHSLAAVGFPTPHSLASGGCPCKDVCANSWLRPGALWCHVDKQCKADGWDLCMGEDAEKLFLSILDEKSKAEHESLEDKAELDGAKKREKKLSTELREAKLQVKETSLQLGETSRQLEETNRRVSEAETRAALLRKKAAEAQKVAERDNAQLKKNIQKLSQAKSSEHEAEAKRMQMRIVAAEDRTKNAVQKLANAEAKQRLVEHNLTEVRELERKATMKAKDYENKLASVLAKQSDMGKKQSDMEMKLAEAAKVHKLDASVHKRDAAKILDSMKVEVQLKDAAAGTEKQLEGVKAQLKEAEKALVAARQEIVEGHRNSSALEGKLANATLRAKAFESELHDTKQVHEKTKKRLLASERKRHKAEADSDLVKLAGYAYNYKKAREQLRTGH